jgi:hypothetical protein
MDVSGLMKIQQQTSRLIAASAERIAKSDALIETIFDQRVTSNNAIAIAREAIQRLARGPYR